MISVIVPVYNVKDTLNRCIDSILHQSYDNFEVILIDDGSTDGSGEICDILCKQHPNMKCVHKKNAGLGMARNSGINIANGDYLIFIDSDDYVEQGMFKDMVAMAVGHSADLVTSNFIYNNTPQNSCITERLYLGTEVKDEILLRMLGQSSGKSQDQFNVSACTKMYSLNLIKKYNMRFRSERELIWEDMAFNFEYLLVCNNVYVSTASYYNYNYNPESLTHSNDAKRSYKIMVMYDYMTNKVKTTFEDDSLAMQRLRHNCLGNMRTCVKLAVLHSKSMREALLKVKEICKNVSFKELIRAVPFKELNNAQKLFSFFAVHNMPMLLVLITKAQNLRKGNQIN